MLISVDTLLGDTAAVVLEKARVLRVSAKISVIS